MATSFIESQVEAEQLCKRIERLEKENITLRELASPTAGSLELQAENIVLQRETKLLTELIPHLVPYEGPLPSTLEEFLHLPEPYRMQVASEHSAHMEKLRQVDQLLRQAADHDRREARRRHVLEDLPVKSSEEFMRLGEQDRRKLAMDMDRRQRLAMCGEAPDTKNEAYL